MTREQCKELLPAIQHFAEGGNLWRYSNRLNEWEIQTTIEPVNKESNIIEDQHFEARKAYALGEEIETSTFGELWELVTDESALWTAQYYRPKPKESVYEWQWLFKVNESRYALAGDFYSEVAAELGWIKFEPSKRIKR